MKRNLPFLLPMVIIALAASPLWFSAQSQAWQGPAGSSHDNLDGSAKRKVVKTDAEWRKLLTRAEYEVTRQKATEPAFSGRYATTHAAGTFKCVACGAELFSSKAKFDSGTGWPSFWQPVDQKSIETAADFHLAEPRIEVMCRDCGAHLGHVFEDGPAPTGLRYCINSLSLKLVPPHATKTQDSNKAKGVGSGSARLKTKAKAKLKTKGRTADPESPLHESASPNSSKDAPKGNAESPSAPQEA